MMRMENVSAASPLYKLISVCYIFCYFIAGGIVTLYFVKYQELLVGVFCIPFILFRLLFALYAYMFSNNPTGVCYRCTLYFAITFCVFQSAFTIIALMLQAIEVVPENWPLVIFAIMEFMLCLYVLGNPLTRTTTQLPYMLIPTQMMVRNY